MVATFIPRSMWVCLAGAGLFFRLGVRADDSSGHGRSRHGESFDEGPRQAAFLLGPERVGKIDFFVGTGSPGARAFFEQGVAQLHGFAYFEAERSFRQALQMDGDCAMALWGMALANRFQPERARELMVKAAALKPQTSAREWRWVEAYTAYFAEKPGEGERRKALVKALERLVMDFPEDLEAKAWLALELWHNSENEIPLTSRAAVESLIAEVLRGAPEHPGAHHFRIHLWNHQEDRWALPSAARCGQSGPGIAHLWHMPGHTYAALSRYSDAAWHQEASARVDHAWMQRRRLMPDQIHNYAHNNDWLVETLGFLGRAREAVELARNMGELPRLAPKTAVIGRSRPRELESSNRMGIRRLMETLVDFELWDEALAFCQQPVLGEQEVPVLEAARQRLLVFARIAKGDRSGAEEALTRLRAAVERASRERVEAADAEEEKAADAGKEEDAVTKAVLEVLRSRKKTVEDARRLLAEAQLYLAVADGNKEGFEGLLKKAEPMPDHRRAQIYLRQGDMEAALKAAESGVQKGVGRVLPAAVKAEVLWSRGDREQAFKAFETLRNAAAESDLDLPVFKRLRPLVEEAGFTGDWRGKPVPASDVGVRPSLSELGPFRWSPAPAPRWNLPNGQGGSLGLDQYMGGPVVLIFYLGGGCMHCIEQLNTFGPMTQAYAEAGIPIVAVSSDSAAELGKTLEKAKQEGGFPFPIVADPELGVFQAYGAYDDFERQALHGVFLIDAAGRVRWQEISAKPFVDAAWLLGEARRLLQF
jgi:peroxiredoxin